MRTRKGLKIVFNSELMFCDSGTIFIQKYIRSFKFSLHSGPIENALESNENQCRISKWTIQISIAMQQPVCLFGIIELSK